MRWLNIFLILTSFSWGSQAFSAIQVNMEFRYTNSDLRMDFYDVDPSYKYSVSRTAVARDISQAPLGKKFDGHFKTSVKESKYFALVLKNNTDKARFFFATPHVVKPSSASISTIFECLCNQHVYEVPARSVWYRVVRFEIFPPDGMKDVKFKNVTMIHDFVEVTEKEANEKYKVYKYEEDMSGVSK